jgi:hypothetical protein
MATAVSEAKRIAMPARVLHSNGYGYGYGYGDGGGYSNE